MMNYKKIKKYELAQWVTDEGWDFLIAAAEHGLIKGKEMFSYGEAYDVLRTVRDYKLDKHDGMDEEFRFAQAIKAFKCYNNMEDNFATFWYYLCPEEKIFSDSSIQSQTYMNNGRWDESPFRQFHNATFSSEIAAKLWILYRLDDFKGGCCQGGEGGYDYIGIDEEEQYDDSKQFHVLMISDMTYY